MWRSKKLIVAVLAATVLLVGSIGGVALAQTGSASSSSGKTLLARVATILSIDQTKLENAFTQARREMRDEALDNYLKNLVAQGKITQEQADQYKKWQQARPDVEPYRQQLRTWQQARPDVSLPGPSGFGGGIMGGGPGYGRGGMMGGGMMRGGMMRGWGR